MVARTRLPELTPPQAPEPWVAPRRPVPHPLRRRPARRPPPPVMRRSAPPDFRRCDKDVKEVRQHETLRSRTDALHFRAPSCERRHKTMRVSAPVMSPCLSQCWSKLVKFGPNLAEIGPTELEQMWVISWESVAASRESLFESGRVRAKLGRCRAELGARCRFRAKLA